ncbi:hypothetical protein ACGF0D_00140 [Kitasatospora sp. NPDC048298]|uniref:hypothetical protein n=1 Tax=Kitasatospora sp. NPDC048298 TaxID=3364049 RepID=UPI00371A88CE
MAGGAPAERRRRTDEQAERTHTGADIDLTWSAVGAAAGASPARVTTAASTSSSTTGEFAEAMYEVRENGHFVSRRRYRHQTEAAVR